MIPAHLPALAKTALLNGWDTHIEHDRTGVIAARFTRHDITVSMWWDTMLDRPRLVESLIGSTPTPYAQCTKLIRNPEGATS